MMLQMRHLVDAPLGYNHERLMEVRAQKFGEPRMLLLLDEVRKLPCVEDAALGLGSPLHAGSNSTYEIDGRTIAWQLFRETESWMKMLDLKLIADYGTTGPNGVKTYVTPNALALHGQPADARAFRYNQDSVLTQIDGLIEPLHLHNILETTYEGRPQMVQLYKEPLINYCLMMRYQGDKYEAKRLVGEVYRKVFECDMENNFNFYDDQLRACYESIASCRWFRCSPLWPSLSPCWDYWPCLPTTCNNTVRRLQCARRLEVQAVKCCADCSAASWRTSSWPSLSLHLLYIV